MICFIHLCPAGELSKRLEGFDAAARERGLLNGERRYSPHCTLANCFEVVNGSVERLIEALDSLFGGLDKPISVRIGRRYLNSSRAAIGLQLLSKPVLRRMRRLAKLLKLRAVRRHSLHVTLAAAYPPEHEDALWELAQEVNCGAAAEWSVLLCECLSSGATQTLRSWPISAAVTSA